MMFRLLGSVHVLSGRNMIHPASGRARSLLACLAWQPRQLIPDDQLIDRIWDERLPEDPKDALYTCAKRLRRTLAREAGSDGGQVVRLAGGYMLDADAEDVDLHRFRHLVRQARQATEPGASACLYERALRISCGTPLADVDSRWATRAREALSRELLSARMAADAIWLRDGRHEELLPDLMYLAEENPLNEEVAGLLMDTLHQGGHTAEALERYLRTRGRLVTELGVEPGPVLRQKYERLLSSTVVG
jgi:DNA-binding SARP family transcriptional activator